MDTAHRRRRQVNSKDDERAWFSVTCIVTMAVEKVASDASEGFLFGSQSLQLPE